MGRERKGTRKRNGASRECGSAGHDSEKIGTDEGKEGEGRGEGRHGGEVEGENVEKYY